MAAPCPHRGAYAVRAAAERSGAGRRPLVRALHTADIAPGV